MRCAHAHEHSDCGLPCILSPVLEAVFKAAQCRSLIAGYWKGTLVAVKTMMFPAAMSGREKREKMAIMETAISASLSHPNIVQVGFAAAQRRAGHHTCD